MDAENLVDQKQQNNPAIIFGTVLAVLLPIGLTILTGSLNIVYYDKLFYSRFIYWFTVLFLFFYSLKIEQRPMLIWKENNEIGFFIISVFVLYLLYIVVAIVSAIPVFLGWHESNEVMKKIAFLLKGHQLMVVFVALTAGVTEELIFRGYMLTRLMQFFEKPYIPVIISSLAFSALHYKYHSLIETLFTFLIGIVFSIYYIKYRNIKALIVTHFLIDFISLSLMQHFKLK